MATDFFYFISSLPAVSLQEPPPFHTYEDFLKHAAEYLSENEMQVLKGTGLCPAKEETAGKIPEILERWNRFETFVRNFLTKYRNGKLKWNRAGDMRDCPDFLPGAIRQLEALLAENDMELRERRLDRMRWEQLDDWTTGHEFDFTAVVIYALRISILVRHEAAAENENRDVLAAILNQAVEEAAAVRVDEHTA